MNYIGIDPGKTGALAVLRSDGGLMFLQDLPWVAKDLDVSRIQFWLNSWGEEPMRAAIEHQQVFPAQGAVSAFTIGQGFGMLKGIFLGMRIPFETPRPVDWNRDLGMTKGHDKAYSVMFARRLFPDAELAGPRGALKDGRAEALLIAEWRRRKG